MTDPRELARRRLRQVVPQQPLSTPPPFNGDVQPNHRPDGRPPELLVPTLTDSTTTADLGAPPIMVTRNNKGRPVAAVGGEDDIDRNMELIRAQEGYRAPRSTKDQLLALYQGGIPGAIDYATSQNTRNRWAVGQDIEREEAAIQRAQGVSAKQAAIQAAKVRPVVQQAGLELRGDAQDEREINNALSQYNKLESYDPDDPADVGLRQYFESRKLQLPAKRKGSNQQVIWRNGRVEVVDKLGGDVRPALMDGQPVGDMGRTPNAQGLTPQQQAQMDRDTANRESREREGGKNRTSRETTAGKLETGRNTRQQRQLSAPSKRAGVVAGADEQLYGKAKSYWDEAQLKRKEAEGIKPQPGYQLSSDQAATKARLLREANGLENRTRNLQEQGDKLRRTGAVSTSQATTHGFSISAWLKAHPGKTEADAKADHDANYSSYKLVP